MGKTFLTCIVGKIRRSNDRPPVYASLDYSWPSGDLIEASSVGRVSGGIGDGFSERVGG